MKAFITSSAVSSSTGSAEQPAIINSLAGSSAEQPAGETAQPVKALRSLGLLAEPPADVACRCTCREWVDQLTDQMLVDEGWSFCECKCCGIPGQQCKELCSEICKVDLARRRGKDVDALMMSYGDDMTLPLETKKDHPIFCEDCRCHGLFDLRCQAVQRVHMRKRSAETQGASAAKRMHKATSEDAGAGLRNDQLT